MFLTLLSAGMLHRVHTLWYLEGVLSIVLLLFIQDCGELRIPAYLTSSVFVSLLTSLSFSFNCDVIVRRS